MISQGTLDEERIEAGKGRRKRKRKRKRKSSGEGGRLSALCVSPLSSTASAIAPSDLVRKMAAERVVSRYHPPSPPSSP